MLELAIALVTETARVLYEGSLYILIGFAIAGLLQEFLPGGPIARHLGSESPRSVLWRHAARRRDAALLVRRGARGRVAAPQGREPRRAITSFLISTPETGEEAIALTWGMLGPLMAIVRPIVALVTAAVAGLLVLFVRESAGAGGGRGGPRTITATSTSSTTTRRARRIRSPCARASRRPLRLRDARRRARVLARRRHRAHGPADGGAAERLLLEVARLGPRHRADARDDARERAALPVRERVDAGRGGADRQGALARRRAGVPAHRAGHQRRDDRAWSGRCSGARVLRVYLASIAGVAVAAGLLLDAFAADRVRAAVVAGAATPDGGLLALLEDRRRLRVPRRSRRRASGARASARAAATWSTSARRIGAALRALRWRDLGARLRCSAR